MSRRRLDVRLAEEGFFDSRERAKAAVMSGVVYVNGQKETKPGTPVSDEDVLEVRGALLKYVSRGGLKLEKALDDFGVSPLDKICLDCGASTGGFTDCLLQRGARRVYAVDVGYGQLDWRIRSDPRVVTLERTNIRYVTSAQIPDPIGLAAIDVSFISLKLVLPVVRALTAPGADVVCLIKPQFEAGRGKVGKKGVVRDRETHKEVLSNFVENAENTGYQVKNLTFSPIKGPEGNIEFLGHLTVPESPDDQSAGPIDLEKLVADAHDALDGGGQAQ
jgi:23S rRNA (cytidine1920-2'-O)/16S rRNA (cytidine1409-2'-O)-methyltransferase